MQLRPDGCDTTQLMCGFLGCDTPFSSAAEKRGWLAGLRDPQIGRALSMLHARPTETWTAEALAVEVDMSRSSFAERFSSVVGQPPKQYLAVWRMHMADKVPRLLRELTRY
jgi:AraC-like DNA-binding protein